MKNLLLLANYVLLCSICHAQEKILDTIEGAQVENIISEDTLKLTAIEKAFLKLDLNGDNNIEFKEFQMKNMNVKSKRSSYSVKAVNLSKKFSDIDSNANQKIDIVEFETAMTSKKEKAYIIKKLEIFSKIDANNDGKIDLNEFNRVKAIGRIKYYKKGNPKYKEEKFAEIDTNDDGYINIEEFEIDKKLASEKG